MNLTIKILQEQEVFDLIKNTDFLETWHQLAMADLKDTIIQEPAFVISWYKAYETVYGPLLLLAYDPDQQLIGVMPLAINRLSQRLAPAGDTQAEYHGWVCKPAYNETFLVEALITIKHAFSLRRWQWVWLPTGTDINWFESPKLKAAGVYVSWQSQKAPLWDLHDKDRLTKSLKNRAFRVKINRYKRRGTLKLEKITSADQLKGYLSQLAQQCDFRKEATYNVRPFEDDPNKARFLMERINYPTANHVTVLLLNNRPLAFHYGTADQERVHLGIITYDPSESKNSPGNVLLLLLGQLLTEEGYRFFDLTAGSDPYKDRFSNCHQLLHRPSVFFSQVEHQKGKLRLFIKRNLMALCKKYSDPHRIRIKIADYKEKISLLRTMKRGDLLKLCKQALYSQQSYQLYQAETNLLPDAEEESGLRHQCYEDLMAYKGDYPYRNRRCLLKNALDRFLIGEEVFTQAATDGLSGFIWLKFDEKPLPLGTTGKQLEISDKGILLYDLFYDNSAHDDAMALFLRQVLANVKKREVSVLLLLNTKQDKWKHLVESCGFQPIKKYHIKKLFSIPLGNRYLN